MSSPSRLVLEEDLLEEELFEINIDVFDDLQKKNITSITTCLDTITEQEQEEEEQGNSKVDDDVVHVYVAVGERGDSSMEALKWALNYAATTSSSSSSIIISLIHVFPQINLIPSPLGKFPRSHVNVEYVDHYLTKVKAKKKLLLQNYIDLCLHSNVLRVEMMLIESDNVAQAIVELIGKLDIRILVIGTTPSGLRRKSGSRRRNSIADKVLKKAQESCDVKIICQGREVTMMEQEQVMMIRSNSSSSCSKDSTSSPQSQDENETPGRAAAAGSASVPFMRFISNPISLFRPRLLSPR